jgi:hypothetical protein
MVKDMEGTGRGLICANISKLAGETEENNTLQ